MVSMAQGKVETCMGDSLEQPWREQIPFKAQLSGWCGAYVCFKPSAGSLLLLLGWPGVVAVKGNHRAFIHKLFVPLDPAAPCAELIPRCVSRIPAVTQHDREPCACQGLMLSSDSAAPVLSGSCDEQGFPPVCWGR